MADKQRYTATGIVWGNCWGGGKCGYAAHKIIGETLEAVEVEAKKRLENGSLDGGMGFESLYAATLNVKVETIKHIDGKDYIHTSYDKLFLGDTTENEEEYFLFNHNQTL